mmetsp:Transcript_69490/g.184958  ORF Transcript_69490/g.184958 Transcript_69490/m.184958 type:complete len:221 (+) Transcript_69490:631-1293(+)
MAFGRLHALFVVRKERDRVDRQREQKDDAADALEVAPIIRLVIVILGPTGEAIDHAEEAERHPEHQRTVQPARGLPAVVVRRNDVADRVRDVFHCHAECLPRQVNVAGSARAPAVPLRVQAELGDRLLGCYDGQSPRIRWVRHIDRKRFVLRDSPVEATERVGKLPAGVVPCDKDRPQHVRRYLRLDPREIISIRRPDEQAQESKLLTYHAGEDEHEDQH